MDIKIAVVENNSDITKTGLLWVRDDNSDNIYQVYYTSPYLGKFNGLLAIPPNKSRVLICLPDNDNQWHYLCTTTAPPMSASLSNPDTVTKNKGLPDNQLYRARGSPMRVSMSDESQNKIVLSAEYNEKFFNTKAEVISAAGKKLSLNDSPKIDCVILTNEHGDGLKISADVKPEDSSIGARSALVECNGSIDLIARKGRMNLTVLDGTEINIINESTGAQRSGPNDSTPGNINITSNTGDINLTVKDNTGTIYLEAQGSNGHIVLKSSGTVDIIGDKGVNISSEADIKITGSKIYLN
jgi:hypothetical protein